MKNVFKKISLLSSAALVALGLCAPMASAAAPTADSMGALYGETVSIGKGAISYTLALSLAQGLGYTGHAQQLINAVTSTGLPTGAKLYLRVKDANAESQLPADASEWVEYINEYSLESEHLTGTAKGTYRIYYYIDGGEDYNDIASLPEHQEGQI